MPEFKSLKDLQAFVQDVVNMELEDSIAQVIKDGLTNSAESNVYGVYSPKKYPRRHSLSDQGNMDVPPVTNGVLEVRVVAPFDNIWPTENTGDELAGLVEFGDGWNGHAYEYLPSDREPTFLYPRPFIQPVREEIGSDLKDIMKQALRNAGLKVK